MDEETEENAENAKNKGWLDLLWHEDLTQKLDEKGFVLLVVLPIHMTSLVGGRGGRLGQGHLNPAALVDRRGGAG